MSVEYDDYINNHKQNVAKAYRWLVDNLPDVLGDQNVANDVDRNVIYLHDESKYDEEEYQAYDDYFYGGNRSSEVVDKFNYAWLHHIHNNPHHWQYWVLINDEPNEGMKILDMPDCYIIEMICDWWAFSWRKYEETENPEDLKEIFKWYDKHKDYMKLSDYTENKVNSILADISLKLMENQWNNIEN